MGMIERADTISNADGHEFSIPYSGIRAVITELYRPVFRTRFGRCSNSNKKESGTQEPGEAVYLSQP